MKKTILVLVLGSLAGCATTSGSLPSSETPRINAPSDDASVSLAEAARSVSQSLNELKAIEKASNPPPKALPYPTAAGLLDKIVASVDWSGPIEPLLKRIAKLAGYRLVIMGHTPSIPVLVTISAQNTPLSDIVRNIDLQSGQRANIAVYPGVRTLELRYAKN